jgi:hypothetical protein
MKRLPADMMNEGLSAEIRFKFWSSHRPFGGVYLEGKPGTEKVDTNGLDVIIVLLRALRAYGWTCEAHNEGTEAYRKIVDMNLGWDEGQDKQAKKALLEKIVPNCTRDEVEALCFENILDDGLEALIVENKWFRLIDSQGIFLLNDKSPLSWVNIPPPFHTHEELHWTGVMPLQEHMDKFFSLSRKTSPDGKLQEDSCLRLGNMTHFIYLEYTPSQVRSFKELSKFDLHTMVRDVEGGRKVMYEQDTRYHILAIVRLSYDGHEDIRVYDQQTAEIEEFAGDNLDEKLKSRRKIPHWTVETAGDARFILVYYALLEPPNWPVDRLTMACNPMEYRRRKPCTEDGTTSLEANSDGRGHSIQDRSHRVMSDPMKGPIGYRSANGATVRAGPSTGGDSIGQSQATPKKR